MASPDYQVGAHLEALDEGVLMPPLKFNGLLSGRYFLLNWDYWLVILDQSHIQGWLIFLAEI